MYVSFALVMMIEFGNRSEYGADNICMVQRIRFIMSMSLSSYVPSALSALG